MSIFIFSVRILKKKNKKPQNPTNKTPKAYHRVRKKKREKEREDSRIMIYFQQIQLLMLF